MWGGWEYSIVTALAANMNFTLDISAPPDGERWGENKNGTFTGQQQQSHGDGREIMRGRRERATNSLSYVHCHYEWWSWD